MSANQVQSSGTLKRKLVARIKESRIHCEGDSIRSRAAEATGQDAELRAGLAMETL